MCTATWPVHRPSKSSNSSTNERDVRRTRLDLPMDSVTGSTETVPDGSLCIHRAELQSKGEDRTVVMHFERGTIIAIFDGNKA